MKKLFLLLSVATLFASCTTDYGTTTPKNPDGEPIKNPDGEPIKNQRIHGVEETVYNNESYQIIEIDGVEYLTKYSGGICPLVKDTIK